MYQILRCRYSLETSQRDDSNKYPQRWVWKRGFGFRMPSLPLKWNSDQLRTTKGAFKMVDDSRPDSKNMHSDPKCILLDVVIYFSQCTLDY